MSIRLEYSSVTLRNLRFREIRITSPKSRRVSFTNPAHPLRGQSRCADEQRPIDHRAILQLRRSEFPRRDASIKRPVVRKRALDLGEVVVWVDKRGLDDLQPDVRFVAAGVCLLGRANDRAWERKVDGCGEEGADGEVGASAGDVVREGTREVRAEEEGSRGRGGERCHVGCQGHRAC